MSSNFCINKNKKKIILFKDIINDITLYSIDISRIFCGKHIGNLDDFTQKDYISEISSFKTILKDNDKKYKQLENEINNIRIDIKKKKGKLKMKIFLKI